MKVYVVGTAYDYLRFIQREIIRVNHIEHADLVLFTGGEDVSPGLYGHETHPYTGSNADRDIVETEKFAEAYAFNKFMVGICRGSQFLTVMSGGKLFQDVDNHAISGTHTITLSPPDDLSKLAGTYHITSTHHQMMYPWTAEQFEILAVADPPRCTFRDFLGKRIYGDNAEPEIVWYPHTKALCIQGHPEYMHHSMPIIPVINKLIEHYIV